VVVQLDSWVVVALADAEEAHAQQQTVPIQTHCCVDEIDGKTCM